MDESGYRKLATGPVEKTLSATLTAVAIIFWLSGWFPRGAQLLLLAHGICLIMIWAPHRYESYFSIQTKLETIRTLGWAGLALLLTALLFLKLSLP